MDCGEGDRQLLRVDARNPRGLGQAGKLCADPHGSDPAAEGRHRGVAGCGHYRPARRERDERSAGSLGQDHWLRGPFDTHVVGVCDRVLLRPLGHQLERADEPPRLQRRGLRDQLGALEREQSSGPLPGTGA